jgi:glucokinase
VIVLVNREVSSFAKNYNIKSLACGLPGLIDYKRGRIHSLTNIPGWDGLCFKKMLENSTGVSSFIDNDVNLSALAEHRLGSGRGSDNMLMVSLGTGVGGGLILNGEIYRGRDNAASEIGHIQLDPKGPKCGCGGRGCLESYIGNRRLLSYLRKNIKKSKSILKRIPESDLSLEDLAKAAASGDNFSVDFWNYLALKLSQALGGVVNLLNLDIVVIGGGISNAGESLFKPLRKYIKDHTMDIQGKSVRIVRASFKERSGVIGAGLLGKDSLNRRAK